MLFSEPKIPQNKKPHPLPDGVSVSVLFSEPKIPQLKTAEIGDFSERVSVLFSEPKIPQIPRLQAVRVAVLRFSALQRAENSST